MPSDQLQRKEGWAPSLDLTARSIDLVNTLTQASTSAHPHFSTILEIGEWLGREKLSRNDLEARVCKAKGLVTLISKDNASFPAFLWKVTRTR